MVGLKFSQLGCDTQPFSYPSGTRSFQERTEPWGIEDGAWLCNPTHHKSRWRAASEAHGQLDTLHQRQPKSYEYMERECASDLLLLFFPHCTVKILVFTCRAYLAPNKFTLGRNIDASKLHVVRNAERVNLVMTSVTSISITVLKLFLPDIRSCFSVKYWDDIAIAGKQWRQHPYMKLGGGYVHKANRHDVLMYHVHIRTPLACIMISWSSSTVSCRFKGRQPYSEGPSICSHPHPFEFTSHPPRTSHSYREFTTTGFTLQICVA